MVEKLMEQQVILGAMGIVSGLGIFSKLISYFTLRRMVGAAANMNKSNHKLMKLVKAKFEHASMISDKVQNVRAFVKKYIYEYRVFGIRLHTWRQLETKTIWLVGILGALGAAMAYRLYGQGDAVAQYIVWGAAGVAVMFFLHISTDEAYCLDAVENYMIDFLENVCAHRYTRNSLQKEFSQKELEQEEVLQMEETVDEPAVEVTAAIEKELEAEKEPLEEKVTQEVQIRKILEEFLA